MLFCIGKGIYQQSQNRMGKQYSTSSFERLLRLLISDYTQRFIRILTCSTTLLSTLVKV